ncbi:SDR family NAD(P)-dependent oxidoreductase [Sphingomonas sp.]|uniref:SDR family NAD(P)-dependent oxidoreductase n=1 Tax=Sphingomonas sp. TaxID=28214 RepID=UPI002DD671EF|nr:SDR family oxidoreductase [Sphingomonas sp.]
MIDVAGKVAFVTGGASGIGLGIAEALLEAGMRVVVADIDASAAGAAADRLAGEGPEAMAVTLDVTDRASWEAAAAAVEARFGPVDVLCNNAGVAQSRLPGGQPLLMTDMSESLFRMVIDVNVVGVFLGVRTFGPRMIARGQGGSIVNTASMAGFLSPMGSSAYVTSKFACVGLSETLRAELAPHGIGVSVFCPGAVKSNLTVNSAVRRAAVVHDSEGKQTRLDDTPSTKIVMPAIAAGRKVLDGIRANDLYIFSHPEFRELVEERFAAVLASFGAGALDGYRDPDVVLTMSRNPAHAEILARRAG